MDHDVREEKSAKEEIPTISELARLATETSSPAMRMLIRVGMEVLRRNAHGARHFLAMADEACKDEAERCYVLHIAAVFLFLLGDMHMAVEKAKASLDLCDPFGYRTLHADVLSHMAAIYGALGHAQLAAAYAVEAAKRS